METFDVGAVLMDRYKILKHIGSGSFGMIFDALDTTTNTVVALKVEKKTTKSPQLYYESRIYHILEGITGFAQPFLYGECPDTKMKVFAMQRLGASLEDIKGKGSDVLPLRTVLMCALQMMERIECLHRHHIIHRDIKSENFLIGSGENDKNLLYLIDFGLSKRYKDPKTKQHIPYREGKNLVGTARFASIHTHLGIEQSRRDDMEAIGYLLIYLAKGTLPWQGVAANNKKEKYHRICDLKMATPIHTLCAGLPAAFPTYMKYVRELQFDERPNYSYLRRLFQVAFADGGFVWDGQLHWQTEKDVSV